MDSTVAQLTNKSNDEGSRSDSNDRSMKLFRVVIIRRRPKCLFLGGRGSHRYRYMELPEWLVSHSSRGSRIVSTVQ